MLGSWGGTGSGATNINGTYFAATTGWLNVSGRIFYSIATGNWNTPATWSNTGFGGTASAFFPGANDDVNIGRGYTVTVSANASSSTVTYEGGNTYNSTLTIGAGFSLAVSGAITIPRGVTNSPTTYLNQLNVGNGNLTAGSLAFTNGGTWQLHQLNINNGTATITGDVTQIGSNGSATINFTGTGTLNVAGAFLNSTNGTLNQGTGTVNYNGAAQTVGDFTYYNLTLSGSGTKDLSTQTAITNINNNFTMSGTASATAAAAMTIGGAVNIGAGTTFSGGAFTHNIAGNWTNNGTFVPGTSTITLNGAATQTIGGTTANFYNLAMTGSGTNVFSISTAIASNLSIGSGVVCNLSTLKTHTARTLTLNGANKTLLGSWGGTGSGATNINGTYFAATTGWLNVSGRVFYSIATGNWNTPATWSNAGFGGAASAFFPGANDDVNIGRGFTVTVSANAASSTVTYEGGNNYNSTLSIGAGLSLAVSGAIIIPRGVTNSPTTYLNQLNVGDGSLTAGSLAFTNGGLWQLHQLNINNGTATITGDVTQIGSVTSATINFTGTGTLNVAGAFLNSTNCTFTAGNGTVNYNGTAVAQTIGDFTYNNLVFNNTSGTSPQLTLYGNATVSNVLTMASGVVNLNGNTLTLSSATSGALVHTTTASSGWLYGGTVSRAFPAVNLSPVSVDGLLPIGTLSNFRPFFISKTNTGGSSGSISLTHSDPGSTTTGLSIPDSGPIATIIIRNNAVWNSTLTNGTGALFGIQYGGTGLGTVNSLNDVRSMLQTTVIGTNITATQYSLTNPIVQRSGLSAAQLSNSFYVGSTNASSSLPIELVSFTGTAKNYGVELHWQTQSELNNNYFTVLRSAGETNFVPVGRVAGSGTSNTSHSYSLTDNHPSLGVNYYQLQQTDFDGTVTSFETIAVVVTDLSPVKIYPNPVSQNQQLTVEINNLPASSAVPLQVVNMQGIGLIQATVTTDENGSLKTAVSTAALAPGIYILSAGGVHYKFVVD